ncbi:MAG TPA: cob(I)yrinic acid a,c-diamide adenosyltransferase [Porphyromonadaceae bacterium]|nr:cob(I)yrinic acid a,c-diamide adenosyltransferase [Porphyromonadaceae bacterium]
MKNSIYTKGGDEGFTSLIGGIRVSKNDKRLQAYGCVDELNSFIGHLLSKMGKEEEDRKLLLHIQHTLFSIGGYLATDCSKVPLKECCRIREDNVMCIEEAIDEIEGSIPPIHAFILPGGGECASIAHICRTLCRKTEREIVSLHKEQEVDKTLLAYINRLSDYFFVLAKKFNFEEGIPEVIWEK